MGYLYIVSTPIGNMEDLTLRALRILREADVIAAEDTRHTRLLLDHYQIRPRQLVSCHAFNEHEKVSGLVEQVKNGRSVALVSDAGTPSVADPGFLLVRTAVEQGVEPEVIPGVSALTFAVTASALPVDRFCFRAFAPVKAGQKEKFLREMLSSGMTNFFFESPYRVSGTLAMLADIAPDCRVALIREATKIHEEVIRGSASELAALKRDWKGEFVIGVRMPDVKGEKKRREDVLP
ncbi:MAG: 16S rRNA (cytidine(1402)-2'-O)-methyltransferase [Lentisphaeria bacterium]|nr:16S rRNA (cytidine(1402)-2'-O)-methyltransferase [Lentisphaeria bacterium]